MMNIIALSLPRLFEGLLVTIVLSAISVFIGFNLGLGLALLRCGSNRFLARFAKGYSTVFRGTPLLVQIFLFYYGLGQIGFVRHSAILWWIVGDGAHCAVFALALNTAAYTSEILRGGFMSVPKGVVESAVASGMSRALCFRRITFPLSLRQALPAYSNEVVLVVKGTSLASTITVLEITGYAKRLMSETFAIIEVFAIAGALYLILNMMIILALRRVERRLMPDRAV